MPMEHENCPCMETCPLNRAMALIGGKWKMQILCSLYNNGPTRYNQLKKTLDGVSNTVLANALRELEGDGLVHRREYLDTLLDGLLPLQGLERLRLMYLYPAGMTHEMLKYLREAGKPFVPYFDVPVQHSHPDVLSRMGRPFARNPREAIDRIRNVFPEAALRTSIMVGFPGETEEHFEHLREFIEEVRFQHLGVFAYRAEEGTPAAAMPDQVEDRVKEWRRDLLMEAQADISAEWLSRFEGDRLSILVDAPHPEWPGLHTGRAWFQAPEIDGMVYISGPGVEPGALVDADIVECRDYDLVALA